MNVFLEARRTHKIRYLRYY